MARHPVDLLSFVTGLMVLSVGLLLLTGGVSGLPMEWVGPAVAIGLGVMIAFAARPERPPREPGEDASPPTDRA